MGQEVTWYTKVQMVVHVPVEDSTTIAVLTSSGGTPGRGVIRSQDLLIVKI